MIKFNNELEIWWPFRLNDVDFSIAVDALYRVLERNET